MKSITGDNLRGSDPTGNPFSVAPSCPWPPPPCNHIDGGHSSASRPHKETPHAASLRLPRPPHVRCFSACDQAQNRRPPIIGGRDGAVEPRTEPRRGGLGRGRGALGVRRQHAGGDARALHVGVGALQGDHAGHPRHASVGGVALPGVRARRPRRLLPHLGLTGDGAEFQSRQIRVAGARSTLY